MTDRELLQMALDAWFREGGINYHDFMPYMETLRARLAQPEPEPLWIRNEKGKLELHAPPKKEWVGLTDKTKLFFIKNCVNWTTIDLIEAVEIELKEKNDC